MNDLYSIITGMIMHAYTLVVWSAIILVPAGMLFRAFFGKRPI